MSDIETGLFTIEELNHVIDKFKNDKSPGPDGIPMEFYKWLNEDARVHILFLLNKCWELEILPDTMELAEVVTLYKKGLVEKNRKL